MIVHNIITLLLELKKNTFAINFIGQFLKLYIQIHIFHRNILT